MSIMAAGNPAPAIGAGRGKPRLSAIINNYNYGRFVGRAVESALEQTCPDIEIIVVDDGSTDDSRQVLAAYADRVRTVFQPNGGQAAAINAGVRASRGEYLCFLDADDWWAPTKLATVAAAFDAHPRAALVYHRLQPVLSDGSRAMKPIPRTLVSGDLSPLLRRSGGVWPFPLTSGVAVRRSAWDEVGEIPEAFRICADAWLVGVYPFAGRVSAVPEALGCYRIHENYWYSAANDEATVRRRMANWRLTVEETNRFLATHRPGTRLKLRDHFPYRDAAASLAGAGPIDRLALLRAGLVSPGEPHLLRRVRDAARAAWRVPRRGAESRTGVAGSGREARQVE
jgi:glycosyltransferase involved in cell wall biosynthesis